jgi:hypothetical protein
VVDRLVCWSLAPIRPNWLFRLKVQTRAFAGFPPTRPWLPFL